MIADAIFKALVDPAVPAAAAICAVLAQYGGKPCIFTDELPQDAALPAILINEIGGDSGFACRSRRGANLNVDVQIFGSKSYTSKATRALAKACWLFLGRLNLNPYITGFSECGCVAEPPANTNDGLGFPGYTIRVRVTVLETLA